jgi:hypothetical protein
MKKAISPLISVMLIIVISFILILVYSLWMKDVIITTTDETKVELGSYLDCQQLKFFEDSCSLEINDVNYVIDNMSIVLDNQSNLELKNININIFGTDNYLQNISSSGRLIGTIKKGQKQLFNTNEDFEWRSGNQISEFYTITKITVVSEVCPEKIIHLEDCYYGKEFCDNPSIPTFSQEGGLYPDYYDLNISLSSSCSSETDYKIYYTTDGTTPTEESTEYTEPIVISDLGETTVKAVVYAPQSNFTTGISPIKEETYYVGGSEPLNGEIYYLEHLAHINTNSTTLAGDYSLMRDLDFQEDDSYYDLDNKEVWTDGNGWVPIGDNSTSNNDSRFNGNFNGNNKKISNIYINRLATDYVGLFGFTITSEIKDLILEDVFMDGNQYVGGIAGTSHSIIDNILLNGTIIGNYWDVGGISGYNSGIIKNSVVDINILGKNNFVGGIAGRSNYGDIYNTRTTGVITGQSTSTGGIAGQLYDGIVENSSFEGDIYGFWTVGGLVGYNRNALISKSYFKGNISGNEMIGGLVGKNGWVEDPGNIYDSYSISDINRLAGTNQRFGLFIGLNTGGVIKNSYSDGNIYYQDGYTDPTDKGFSGEDDLNVVYINNYFDINSSNQQTSTGALGRTTEQMQKLISYSSSLEFDGGSQNLVVTDLDVSDISNGLTVSSWVKIDLVDETRKRIVSQGTGAQFIRTEQNSNQIYPYLKDINDNIVAGAIKSNVVSFDDWLYVTLTIDSDYSGNIKLYINGILDKETINTLDSDLITSGNLEFGGFGDVNSFFTGLLKDVRIYNKALTSDEVEELYNKDYIPDGLIGWWPLNETEGDTVYDLSGNNNHGTLKPDYPTNSPQWSEDSPLRWDVITQEEVDQLVGQSALSFDGESDYVGDINLDVKKAPWTVSGWAKVSKNVLNTSDHYTVFSQGNYRNGGWWVYYRDDHKYWSFWLDDGTNTSIINGLGEETVDEWTHIAINYDVNYEFSLYMNGNFIGKDIFEIGDTVESFVIGARTSGTDRLFSGLIDDVRIYNRALLDTEIQQLYNKQQISDGLVGHWKLDEKIGDVANDSSGNNNHGTIHGASWYPTWYIDEDNDYPRLTWELNN